MWVVDTIIRSQRASMSMRRTAEREAEGGGFSHGEARREIGGASPGGKGPISRPRNSKTREGKLMGKKSRISTSERFMKEGVKSSGGDGMPARSARTQLWTFPLTDLRPSLQG